MAQFHKVLTVNELPIGSMKHADVSGLPLAIYNVNAKIYATTDICSHHHCLLTGGTLSQTTVECPCHGGKFDMTTGAVLALPPIEPIKTYPVRVIGNNIEVEIE